MTAVTEEEVTSVFEHAHDEDVEPPIGAALGCTLYLITIVTISGNTSLLVILLKTNALRTVTNSFIVSLAICDLLTGIFVMPYCASALVTGNWPFLSGYCKVAGFIHSACSIATLLTIMMVCADRVLAVAKPLKYSLYLTPLTVGIMIFYVWLHSILLSVIPFASFDHYTFDRPKGFCPFDWRSASHYVLTYAVTCLLIPSVITFILLLIILKHARSRPTLVNLMPVPVAAVSLVVHSQPMVNYRRSTIQAMRTLFVITITVTALWTPQITLNLLDLRHSHKNISDSFRTSAMWLCLMSSMTNPLIFLMNRKFKQKFREIFCRCLLKRSNVVGIDASVTQNTMSTAVPNTSHYEHSHVFSKARPSQATIPEEENLRRISFCEPQVKIGVKTELLLAVPNRSKQVPVAKVEPLYRSSVTSRRSSVTSHRSSIEPRRSSLETIRRISVDPSRVGLDMRRASSDYRRGSDTRARSHGDSFQACVDVDSTMTSESTSSEGYPPVIISVTPQLHAIPADMTEDLNNDFV